MYRCCGLACFVIFITIWIVTSSAARNNSHLNSPLCRRIWSHIYYSCVTILPVIENYSIGNSSWLPWNIMMVFKRILFIGKQMTKSIDPYQVLGVVWASNSTMGIPKLMSLWKLKSFSLHSAAFLFMLRLLIIDSAQERQTASIMEANGFDSAGR